MRAHAALVKGRDFVLIFSPRLADNAIGAGLIAGFLLVVWVARSSASAGSAVNRLGDPSLRPSTASAQDDI